MNSLLFEFSKINIEYAPRTVNQSVSSRAPVFILLCVLDILVNIVLNLSVETLRIYWVRFY